MQVMTVVEGKIHKTRAQDFLSMYASVRDQVKPPGWKRSMLLQDTGDKDLFRISTLWESREALEQMRKNSKVPFAVQIFRTHGTEPNVRIFEVPYAFEA
ncbi:MAG TPA: antibiotic biosynthesis monooxygenase [Candidatus Dormibacteraeota bacterium]|nr:antibiotic biosynthesis monooxygenase [Candidatus Dormibacteraeota bacterium]